MSTHWFPRSPLGSLVRREPPRARATRLALATVVAAAVATAAGCASDGSPGAAAAGPSSAATAAATAGGAASAPSASAWPSGPTSVARTRTPSPQLVAVRSAHNVDAGVAFDRVVLEFRGGLPGYTAQYVDQVVKPGQGVPIDLAGHAFFEITLTPATAHDTSGNSLLATPVITGSGMADVQQVALAGDFEGYVHLGIGLGTATGYRVTELTGPDRLVFDFASRTGTGS